MGDTLTKLFIDPKLLPNSGFGFFQVSFIGAVYGKILFDASNLISDGSELLLLIPSFAGIVGSIVLPVLGAVPDGAIVLFSGMGDNAQEQLSVGVGALAGSTIMLLTLPWALSIYSGRVNLNSNGKANYCKPKGAEKSWSKLMPADNKSLTKTGINVGPEISINGITMVLTSLIYLIIQIPAYKTTGFQQEDALVDNKALSKQEHFYAIIGLVLCIFTFFGYLVWNVRRTSQIAADIVEGKQIEGIRNKEISLSAIMGKEFRRMVRIRQNSSESNYGSVPVLQVTKEDHDHLEQILRPFFKKYDTNHDNKMDKNEIFYFFQDLNEDISKENLDTWFEDADLDNSGYIEFHELVNSTLKFLRGEIGNGTSAFGNKIQSLNSPVEEQQINYEMKKTDNEEDQEEEEEEEEDIPDDLIGLSMEEQQYKIKVRAFTKMAIGTFLVMIFSDPMVDVLSEIGTRTGVPAFYISFVLAPLASNASELIASFNYAKKKTSKTISISISALLGAACMNNTFCLGIFMGLMSFNNLAWKFSAETITILFVQFIMGYMAMKRTQTLMDALIICSLFPLSIGLIAALQNIFNFD